MLPKNFSLSRIVDKSLDSNLSFRFRDKDKLVHNASDAAKDHRQVVAKALGYKESNPTDKFGKMRMFIGSAIEDALKYKLFSKLGPYGVHLLSAQGDAGEHGTFYGTSWHGYRDFDFGIKTADGKIKPVIAELKTKVGLGATLTIRKSQYSKEFIIPKPDTEWGNAQQIALYLRDAYLKTKNKPEFPTPIIDGILIQFLYAKNLATFIEYYFEYIPEDDVAVCYRVHCEDYPECCSSLDFIVDLKEIAKRFAYQDEFIKKGELPPPEFERKYDVNDPRVAEASKSDLQAAVQNKLLIGDIQKKYDPYRDLEAEQLGIVLKYTPEEIAVLKRILKNR